MARSPRGGDRNRRKQPPAPQQMDLFAARITGGAPDWPDLPEEAREALVSLMTRLILEPCGRNRDADNEVGGRP